MATPGALTHQISPDHLVERVANGCIPNQLAEEFGVHRSNVHRALHAHPGYPEARRIGMAARLDECELMLRDGEERNIPRARELWRAVTWRAEREHPDVWGQRQPAITINVMTGDQAGARIEQLRDELAALGVIDAPVVIEQHPAAQQNDE